ncbi:hypothetical protein CJD38_08085 [Stenotrophobium rhamnosiphilum]|uniref:Uncharacterized protein n=2 Tax=Stenotrophobium rhamnosiphilum TaxID=2029166 RepID=A0A2T5MFH5_9GAMM|nr:hypothetical protein CJD38_08085 [Stenotrophobium rhamnosiphilum]
MFHKAAPARTLFAAIATVGLLSGCATRTAIVASDASIWNDKMAIIGIAVAPMPKGDTYKSGAQGFLDLAINAAAASDLTTHLESFDSRAFQQVQLQLADKLKARGLTVKIVPGVVDPAQYPEMSSSSKGKYIALRDYSALQRSDGIDRLLLLSLDQVGTSRTYFGFAPTSPPIAVAKASGQMVDLKTGKILWSTSSLRNQSVTPPWDQPPSYPNIDSAIATAIVGAGNAVVSDLAY